MGVSALCGADVLHSFVDNIAIATGRSDVVTRMLETFGRHAEADGIERARPRLRLVGTGK